MKTMKNFLILGATVLMAGLTFSACGGNNGEGNGDGDSDAVSSIPTDGILGELPKAVAEYAASEAAANAKYEELKQSDPDKATEFWTEYLHQGNATKFKKETLPTIAKTLEGKEIPTELAEGIPATIEKNFTLDDKREAGASFVFTAEASNDTPVLMYIPVAFDTDGNAIAVGGRSVSYSDYPIKEGKKFGAGFFISPDDYNAAQWAKLAKIVIMDRQSDAYKQAEEQIKANKEAFKNKE